MLVPFRLTSVTDGIRMTQLIESLDGKTTRVAAQFDYQADGRPLTMEIASQAKEMRRRGPVETQTINGRRVEVRRLSQSLCLGTKSEPICVTGLVTNLLPIGPGRHVGRRRKR